MPSITITISDLPHGQGAIAFTDGDPPAIGRTLTPAQALAMDLLRTCRSQAFEVRYGADDVPLVDLANSLLDPERLGYAATPEIRDRARVALGRQAVESIRKWVRAGAMKVRAPAKPEMWEHHCEVEKTLLSVGAGQACNWCDKPQPDSLLRECHLSGQMSAAQSVAHAAECATPCGDYACDTGCTTARRGA